MKTLEKLKFRIDNQFSEVIDKTKYGWLSAYGFKRDEIERNTPFWSTPYESGENKLVALFVIIIR